VFGLRPAKNSQYGTQHKFFARVQKHSTELGAKDGSRNGRLRSLCELEDGLAECKQTGDEDNQLFVEEEDINHE